MVCVTRRMNETTTLFHQAEGEAFDSYLALDQNNIVVHVIRQA